MTLIRIADALEVSPRDFFPESKVGEGIDVKSEIKNEIILMNESYAKKDKDFNYIFKRKDK